MLANPSHVLVLLAPGTTAPPLPAYAFRMYPVTGIGMSGGQSWTEQWLKFDNSYFSAAPAGGSASELLRLETDSCLSRDPRFKEHFDKYAASQDAFFADCERKTTTDGTLLSPGIDVYCVEYV